MKVYLLSQVFIVKKIDANIVHVIKKYYKIKIDYRDSRSRFYMFLWCPTPCFYSIRASLHSKGTTFGVQRSSICNATEARMECKSSPFAMKRITFALCKIARFRREYCKLLSISNMWLHAQNSRISSQRFRCAFSSQF